MVIALKNGDIGHNNFEQIQIGKNLKFKCVFDAVVEEYFL